LDADRQTGNPGGNAVTLLGSEEGGWITGQLIGVDGGASRMDSALPLDIQQTIPQPRKTSRLCRLISESSHLRLAFLFAAEPSPPKRLDRSSVQMAFLSSFASRATSVL